MALPQMKLSRKERELQFRMGIVLDAAEDVFAESSYAQASVEEIAKRAEISVGTLYNLFHSKEEIYRSMVSRSQTAFFVHANERMDAARGPKEQLHACVSYFFEHFSHFQKAFRHYVTATNGFQWELKSQLHREAYEMQQKFNKRLLDVCQTGMDEGIFKKGLPAELMAATVLGVAHSFLMVWTEQEGIDLMSLVPPALLAVDRVSGAE